MIVMSKFKVGDIVNLNSGGCKMTVTGFEMGFVWCAWSSNNDIKTGNFPELALINEDDNVEQDCINAEQLAKAALQTADHIAAKMLNNK